MDAEIIYLGLSAFLAATLVPVSSEIFFTGYLALGFSKTACLLIASIGNCLGTTFNYGLGVAGMAVAEKYFGFTPARHEKVLALNKKYGKWTLWLAWLPIIGDPITIYLPQHFRSTVFELMLRFDSQCSKFFVQIPL